MGHFPNLFHHRRNGSGPEQCSRAQPCGNPDDVPQHPGAREFIGPRAGSRSPFQSSYFSQQRAELRRDESREAAWSEAVLEGSGGRPLGSTRRAHHLLALRPWGSAEPAYVHFIQRQVPCLVPSVAVSVEEMN